MFQHYLLWLTCSSVKPWISACGLLSCLLHLPTRPPPETTIHSSPCLHRIHCSLSSSTTQSSTCRTKISQMHPFHPSCSPGSLVLPAQLFTVNKFVNFLRSLEVCSFSVLVSGCSVNHDKTFLYDMPASSGSWGTSVEADWLTYLEVFEYYVLIICMVIRILLASDCGGSRGTTGTQ